MDITKDWVYDIETFPNCFTFSIIRCDSKFPKTFEISTRKNETEGLLKCINYLKDNSCRMVGFNNLGFDYPILHKMLETIQENKALSAKYIWRITQKQIDSFKGEGFGNSVPEKDIIVKQVDLYKIWHFDNKAKATSLKMLEFNMKSNNIEDLPFPVGKTLTEDEMDTLVKYNIHDVKMTLDFYMHSLDALKLREELSIKFNKDFTNHNDTKIGKDYFIMRLEESLPGSCYKFNNGKKVINQTKRSIIRVKNCLFDYYDFKHPAFISILNWFKVQNITETKGVFTEIEESLLGDVAKYCVLTEQRKKFPEYPTPEEQAQFKKDHPLGKIEEVELKAKVKGVNKKSYWGVWKEADTLNVVVNGFRFDFGTGGIHGSIESKIARENKKYMIKDADVASMYPNLGISNKVYPEHLSEQFCSIYQDVYEQRKAYKKGTPENAVMKLALNGVYGDSNNQYSPFYDPQYTMKITINGQLSLCLLVEKLLVIPDIKIIQVNTDGVTVALPREHEELYLKICKDWQEQVKLELEFADYSAMYIRDVNNYIAVYTNGKVKRKGAYQYEGLGWHQNHSALVIQKAAEAAMLRSEDPEEFIRKHSEDTKNKFDFLLRTKVPRSSKLVLVYEDGREELQQNICRYYPCKSGGKLVKLMPALPGKEDKGERRLSLDKEWNVKTCNNVLDFTGDIDYDYYIAEAKKLIIEGSK